MALVKKGEVYYYHLDQLNTPRFVTNNKAEVVWENQADVYGYEESEADADTNKENTFTQPIRFQGQYLDIESGLHYNRYRYYSPKQQRFINQDPIGLVGGINHYQYAPNPVNLVDPFGLSCKENTWNEFQKNTKGQFSSPSEASKVYQRNKLAIEGTMPGSVSAEAQSWQGKGAYYGVDIYDDVTIPAGTIVYGGAPGQSSYYTPQDTMDNFGDDSKAIFQALQVGAYKGTYRPGMTAYLVKEDIIVAQGTTLANPQFGSGGAQQYYIPEDVYKNDLEPQSTVILKNTKASK